MKILNSNYSLEAGNYNKRTPAKLKLTADILLFITLIADFTMPWLQQMPEVAEKAWIVWIASGVIGLFKIGSKFIADHE